MAGSGREFGLSDPQYAGPAERAAFANGQQSMQSEIDQLREALRTVHAMLNGPSRYKARNARLYLEQYVVEKAHRTPIDHK